MALTPSNMVELGSSAQYFSLPNIDGKIVSLDDYKNKKALWETIGGFMTKAIYFAILTMRYFTLVNIKYLHGFECWYLPKNNDLWKEDFFLDTNNISEEQFNQVVQYANNIYQPIAAKLYNMRK